MKYNDYFHLNFNQHEVDFVNIDINRDNRLFLDGRALMLNVDPEYYALQRKYMNFSRALNSCLLDPVLHNKHARLHYLFAGFVESSYTRLGFCERGYMGHGVGQKTLKANLVEMLINNSALIKGSISGFHQMSLVVDRIGVDRLSDSITQILTKELADYTLRNCMSLRVPEHQLNEFTLTYFCDDELKWRKGNFKLPFSVEKGRKKPFLFVPKCLVRDKYSATRTFDHFLSFLVQGPIFTEEYFVMNNATASGKNGKFTLKDKKDCIRVNGGKKLVADILSEQKSNRFIIDFEDAYRDRLSPTLTDDELMNIVDCGKKYGCSLAS